MKSPRTAHVPDETMGEPVISQVGSLLEVANDSGRFVLFARAVGAAGLTELLRGKGPLTLFAPVDDAFRELPAGVTEALLSSRSRVAIAITYHIIEGRLTTPDVVRLNGARPRAANGHHLRIAHDDGETYVNHAKVIGPAIEAENGIIYAIDRVLLPWPVFPRPQQRTGDLSYE